MKTWITADWHLGEDRFELMGRPFTSRDQHIDTLINNHNAVVGYDDTVIVVGDVCYQKAPETLAAVGLFHGRKILIRGNHDKGITDEQFKAYFNEVIPEGKGIELDVDGIPCYATHYPTEGRADRFNLVGHIHGAWKYQLNMFNVGVDVNHFRPVNLERVRFHYDAVCKFYDRDVWVGYDPLNSAFQGIRGKTNTYFRPNT